MSKITGNSPWLKMWVEPRTTVRGVVNKNPKQGFLILSAVYGFPIVLSFYQNMGMGLTLPLWALLVAGLLLCTFVGMIGISFTAWLFKVTGRWIGGTGSFQAVRAAVAWSSVPSFVSILGWLILVSIFGGDLFTPQFPETHFMGYEAGVVFLVFLTQSIASVWAFILLLKALGEVQGFSAWRALVNVLIPFAIVVAAVWLMAWILGFATQPMNIQ